jgi:hypothetical protein
MRGIATDVNTFPSRSRRFVTMMGIRVLLLGGIEFSSRKMHYIKARKGTKPLG